MKFDEFFKTAFGKSDDPDFRPFQYQRDLAQDPKCKSRLINIPTGLGKTAAVVLAWLWNRVGHPDANHRATWPRRLVYCLPMRALVEQTRDNVHEWLDKLGLLLDGKSDHTGKIGVHILMGGEERETNRWELYPEHDAILIGTQDMLLSRALNRGYGMSRYRWPMHFALLNNDCLWVMDETQLMGPGLATSMQLDAFRSALWKVEKPHGTWWMSATGSQSCFDSIDRRALEVPPPPVVTLSADERLDLIANGRLGAEKRVALMKTAPKLTARDGSGLLDRHVPGRITLLVVNTVPVALSRHDEIRAHLDKPAGRGRTKPPQPDLLLLHSRFRPPDRARQIDRLKAFMNAQPADGAPVSDHPGLIVVSTQVLEAGFDLSSTKLWSEVAPWPSVIQRLGRLNREGRQPEAAATFWMPKKEDGENGKDAPNARRIGPYAAIELKAAQELLGDWEAHIAAGHTYREALDSVIASPKSQKALEPAPTVFIRPDDVHGLFANEPDLAGGFTNVAPFVRDDDRNADVLLYWRDFDGEPGDAPEICEPDAGRDELVAVPFYEVQRFLRTIKKPAYFWNEEAERWEKMGAAEIFPGMDLLLPCKAGGYHNDRGWTRDPHDKPAPLQPATKKRAGIRRDPESDVGWQTLREHTAAVARASAALAQRLDLAPDVRRVFEVASQWHDVGKAHPRWQGPLKRPGAEPWGKFSDVPRFRPGFRHEAFSLLAAWEAWRAERDGLSALALYLIATHHGKVRTILRSTRGDADYFGLLGEDEPLKLPTGEEIAASTRLKNFAGGGEFDWEARTFTPGDPSWTAVIAELLGPAWRDDAAVVSAVPETEPRSLGPFRLAFLETIFRAADARGSTREFSQP